jgi:hypothetical protein
LTLRIGRESDKVTEQKAYGSLHGLWIFLFNFFWKNQKIGNSKYGILVPKGIENTQSVDKQLK